MTDPSSLYAGAARSEASAKLAFVALVAFALVAILFFVVGPLLRSIRARRRVRVAAGLLAAAVSLLSLLDAARRFHASVIDDFSEIPQNPLLRFFSKELSGADRLVLLLSVVTLTALTGWILVSGLMHLGRAGRRAVLIGLTVISALLAVGLGWWALSLPEPRGAYFVLWHQIVRVGAALSATAFVVGFMALSLPVVLDMLERRGFVPFVAARHVRSSKSGFLTAISILSIAGVGVSSFALCAVVSIMGGFGADLKRKILGNSAHISIDGEQPTGFDEWVPLLDRVRHAQGVVAATPMVSGEAMASSQSNTAGMIVRGIDPASIGSVIDLIENIEVGKLDYLIHPEKLIALPADEEIGIGPGGVRYLRGTGAQRLDDAADEPGDAPPAEDVYPGLIVGRELAKTLHVYVGDEVTLVAPLGDLGPMGVLPRTRHFRVAAVFYSGMYEYDASHAYIMLPVAQDFLDLEGRITNIDVKVQNAETVGIWRPALEGIAAEKGLKARDWKEKNKNLFSALKLEKIATFIILSIAIAVASFCIICTLLLMVTEKSKEIAILKSMGASDRAILKVFVSEGFIIGAIGTAFGVITGLTTCVGLKAFGVRLDPEVYYVDQLPINVDAGEYLLVALAALVITILATIYPAVAASRLRPVEGIRYE